MKTPNPIVIARTVQMPDGSTATYHFYWCPGCDSVHSVRVGRDGWTFAGSLEFPTYSPSQRTTRHDGSMCHTLIRRGMIQFLSDCTHDLRGQTVPLPPLPDWLVNDLVGRQSDMA